MIAHTVPFILSLLVSISILRRGDRLNSWSFRYLRDSGSSAPKYLHLYPDYIVTLEHCNYEKDLDWKLYVLNDQSVNDISQSRSDDLSVNDARIKIALKPDLFGLIAVAGSAVDSGLLIDSGSPGQFSPAKLSSKLQSTVNLLNAQVHTEVFQLHRALFYELFGKL